MVAKFAMNFALECVARVTIAERGGRCVKTDLKWQEKGTKKPQLVRVAAYSGAGGLSAGLLFVVWPKD
jgi:hypothetical protein